MTPKREIAYNKACVTAVQLSKRIRRGVDASKLPINDALAFRHQELEQRTVLKLSKNTHQTSQNPVPTCPLVPPPSSYLYLGAVVCVLPGQQAGEAGLLRRRCLLLLLAGPVAVHAAGVGVEPPPPPVAVERHVHRRVLLVSRLRRHLGVGHPCETEDTASQLKGCTECKWQ